MSSQFLTADNQEEKQLQNLQQKQTNKQPSSPNTKAPQLQMFLQTKCTSHLLIHTSKWLELLSHRFLVKI